MPPRFFLFALADLGAPALLFFAPGCEADPTSAAMARISRSLSFFKSPTILCKSKIRSFGLPALPGSCL